MGLQVLGLNSNPSGPSPPAPTTRAQVMQAHTTLCIKEICLIYLHRGYLARALSEHPDDPFKSRYAASVLAAHRGSCAVLAGVRNAFSLLPRLMPRVFFLWIHAFSAAVSFVCGACDTRMQRQEGMLIPLFFLRLYWQQSSYDHRARIFPPLH